MVGWDSRDNTIANNTISGGRYGLHFMYAQYNLVKDNRFLGNSVGVFLMYSDGVELRGNRISHGLGATGMGIGMKESSDVTLEDNTIVYCATGIYMDVSPYQPDTTNRIKRNYLAFNSIGMLFHNDWTGNVLEDNRFESNFVQVSVNAGASARRNDWDGNYWGDYQGFDRDGDGIGDSVHETRVCARPIMDGCSGGVVFQGLGGVVDARFSRASGAVFRTHHFVERPAPQNVARHQNRARADR